MGTKHVRRAQNHLRWPARLNRFGYVPEPEGRDVADFIVLKRPGPPSREVLINLDQILMVQPGQNSGSAILFGKDHLVNFEEDLPTVIRRIQTGPYVRTGPG
jgi:hypothetical protein